MNWKPEFFLAMEKYGIMAQIGGAMTALSTLSDIKVNKAKLKLANPGTEITVPGTDPYAHQFATPVMSTPNRSLYG